MTEDLLQKLEEKMVLLLAEVENLRKEVKALNQENVTLKQERESHTQKLQDLLSLLDSVEVSDHAMQDMMMASGKPMLVQG